MGHALRASQSLLHTLDFVQDSADQLVLKILSDILLLTLTAYSHASCLETIPGVSESEGEEILCTVALVMRTHGANDIGKFWFGWSTIASAYVDSFSRAIETEGEGSS